LLDNPALDVDKAWLKDFDFLLALLINIQIINIIVKVRRIDPNTQAITIVFSVDRALHYE